MVGGNSALISEQRKQGRTCFYYDLQDDAWSRGPSLQQARWNHGLVRLGDVLYAVGGCGQQNSMEALSLTDLDSGWAPRPPMNERRYVPGVGVLDGLIYVVGGADSQWSPQRTVECFHPGALFRLLGVFRSIIKFSFSGENVWSSLPELHCPRAQPTVAGLGGFLFVMGGRNSKKVELKSVEYFDPLTNVWTLLEDGLKKKRAAAASVAFREDELLVIGGRS